MLAQRIYHAVIFDMDGVLADSEPDYLAGVRIVLARYGKVLREEDGGVLIGQSVSNTWETLIEMTGLDAPYDEVIAQYDSVMPGLLAKPRQPLPGVRALIDELKRRRIPMAIATSSWGSWADALLPSLDLDGAFDAVVHRQLAERPKPEPDLYLKAAEMIGIPPGDCIGVEDTPTGIAAVRNAGMYAIQVRSASTAFPPIPEADLVLDTLDQFPLHLLGPSTLPALDC